MESSDVPTGPGGPSSVAPAGAAPPERAGSLVGPGPIRPGAVWGWVVLASLLAGLGSWACGEATFDFYTVSEAAAKNLQDPGPMRKELAVIVPRNVAIANGAQGALLGLVLGLAGGLARGRWKSGLGAGLAGMVVGGLAGAALSFALVPLFQKHYDPAGQTLLITALARAGIWSAIGAVVGAAFGWGLGGVRQVGHSLLLGFLGGMVGTTVFELVNALANPSDLNDQVIPTHWTSRLIAYLIVAVFVGLGAALSVRKGEKPSAPEIA